jgi:hypothetical protein
MDKFIDNILLFILKILWYCSLIAISVVIIIMIVLLSPIYLIYLIKEWITDKL